MGGSPSKPDNIISVLNNSIVKSVVSTMQRSQDIASQSQIIDVTCTDTSLQIINDSVKECQDTLFANKVTKEDIVKYCQPVINCKASNISMIHSLNITDLSTQTSVIKSNIKSSIENNMKQSLDQIDTSLFPFLLSKDKQKIDNITTTVTENVNKLVQDVENQTTQGQHITLKNFAANNVTLTSAGNIVRNNLQDNTGLQSIISSVANTIVQEMADKANTGLTAWVIKIGGIAIAFIIIVFLIIWLLKRHDTKEFLNMIMPYLILTIGTALIFGLHYLIKPEYIMQTEYVDRIDNGKFIFYCTSYVIFLACAEFIYYRYIKKKNK